MKPIIQIDRVPLSDRWKRTVTENLALGARARRRHRRQAQHWPVRNRWLIIKARARSTWRETWVDLVYLVTGR